MTERVLLRGGHVLSPAGPATALAVEADRVVWVGDDAAAPAYAGGAEIIELGGRLVTPGFVDAHVHTVQSGLQLAAMDTDVATSREQLLDTVASYARDNPGRKVLLGRWDETRFADRSIPTADDLERAAPGRLCYLSRVDGHSAVASTALIQRARRRRRDVDRLDGFSSDGRLERAAAALFGRAVDKMIGLGERRDAAATAIEEMAGAGITALHENAAPHIGPADDLQIVAEEAAKVGVHAVLYWGEHAGSPDPVTNARSHKLSGLAGDLNIDGSLGSRTAALREPYADADTRGYVYLDADQIAHHLVACTEAGLQAGFHCIGDAATEAAAAGLRLAAARVGTEAVRAARHRLEHVEMCSDDVLQVLAELNVTASMQPMFDALWGGPDRMYAERVGERWRGMNPIGAMHRHGISVAFGSDTPVTTQSPWQAVAAAVNHHEPAQQITSLDAFVAHSRGGWAAAGVDGAGFLLPGWRADYVVWDHRPVDTTELLPEPPAGDSDGHGPAALRVVAGGRTVVWSDPRGWD